MFTQPPEFLDAQPLNFCMAQRRERARTDAGRNTVKAKIKLGMGIRKSAKKRKAAKKNKKKKVSLRQIVGVAKASMSPGADAIESALKAARKAVKNSGGRNRVRSPCILPVSNKIGGILPFLIPLFAGLSATGTLAGGAAGIAKAINDAKSAKRDLEESKRHNKTMEAQRSVPETL